MKMCRLTKASSLIAAHCVIYFFPKSRNIISISMSFYLLYFKSPAFHGIVQYTPRMKIKNEDFGTSILF